MLHQRGEIYVSRIIVPTALRPLLGRREITRSLRTADRREARRRLLLWENHIGACLSLIRAQGRSMDREQLDEITSRYLATTFDEIEGRLAMQAWSASDRDASSFELVDKAHQTVADLTQGNYGSVYEAAKAFAPDATEEALRKLCRRLLEVNQEALKAEVRALAGEPLILPRSLVASGVTAVPTAEAPSKDTPWLSDVARAYGDERVSGGFWTAKTELQNRTILALLADLLGNPQVGSVTKEGIRNLGHDVLRLPSNMTKRFPGVPPREVLVRLEGDSTTPRLEPRSVNKYRQLTRSLFKWALDNDFISSNPAAVLKDVKESKARDDRKPFEDADLITYFGILPQDQQPKPFLYWIPRILAYSGMRLSEAAKLQRQDVRSLDGLWVFDVNDEVEGKRLKTEASRRRVPVHPRLIELGLIDFVQGAPEGFLWPADMRTTKNPERGDVDKLSKLLGRRLRASGIKDPKKTGAHSFRHTVSTRLKGESVHDYQISDLIGHDDDSMTTGRYGKATDVARLLEVVKLLRLPV